MPCTWIAFIESGLDFDKALDYAISSAVDFYIEQYSRIEEERATRHRKARWSVKRRSFLLTLAPNPCPKDLWRLALRSARLASNITGWRYRSRIHNPVKLLAAPSLKYIPPPKSYRALARYLKQAKISTGLRKEAYPAKSTLFDISRSIPLKTLLATIIVLYMFLLSIYARKIGSTILNRFHYAVDSTRIAFDAYTLALRRGTIVAERMRVEFSILIWPIGCILCVVGSVRELVNWVKILPTGGVLMGDAEYWCRNLLLECLKHGLIVSIKVRGKNIPIGLRLDLSYYWVRKLSEQVFGWLARR